MFRFYFKTKKLYRFIFFKVQDVIQNYNDVKNCLRNYDILIILYNTREGGGLILDRGQIVSQKLEPPIKMKTPRGNNSLNKSK